MALKMKELVSLTGESKSTILYYLKEGLLPEPKKPKPNVALYDESCVNRIKFIKYLQKNFSYSIAQIQHIFANNRFRFDSTFEDLIEAIGALRLQREKSYSKEDFLELVGVGQEMLKEFTTKGYIADGVYGQSELEAVTILKVARELELDFSLIDSYVEAAKALAKKENDAGERLLKDDSKDHNERYELLFDIILKLKPYIFNSYTVKEHQERISNEESL